MPLKFTKHPGEEYIKVICDVCKGTFYRKDTVLVRDKYNFQFGKVVCKRDLDRINEQVLPNKHYDRPISSPETLRPELLPVYTVNDNDDRLPGPPRQGIAKVNPIDDYVDLFWLGPEDVGSSGIIGYKIARADPQLGTYTVIISDTSSPATYYTDTSSDVSLEYSYKVAAINGFGVGPYSDEFFWPVFTGAWMDIEYLTDGDGNVITGGDGYLIRTNHTEAGII